MSDDETAQRRSRSLAARPASDTWARTMTMTTTTTMTKVCVTKTAMAMRSAAAADVAGRCHGDARPKDSALPAPTTTADQPARSNHRRCSLHANAYMNMHRKT